MKMEERGGRRREVFYPLCFMRNRERLEKKGSLGDVHVGIVHVVHVGLLLHTRVTWWHIVLVYCSGQTWYAMSLFVFDVFGSVGKILDFIIPPIN